MNSKEWLDIVNERMSFAGPDRLRRIGLFHCACPYYNKEKDWCSFTGTFNPAIWMEGCIYWTHKEDDAA